MVGCRVIVMKKNNDSFKYRNRLNDVEPWQSINEQFKGFFLKFEEGNVI